MTPDMWYAVIILVAAIILFVTEWIRVDLVAVGVMVALTLTGLLTTKEAVAGFSNTAVITITALFVVGGAVMHTGLASLIGQRILAIAGTSEVRLIVVVMVAVSLISGFISDTGTVAMLLPAIISLAYSAKVSPSKLLIPLSFGSLLGGAMTLIGTPPNLIISDTLQEAGLKPFSFFAYTPVGILLLIAGIIFMALIGRKLLPDYKPQKNLQHVDTPDDLVAHYRLPASLFRLRVRRNSELLGKTIAETTLRDKFNINVLEILRPPTPRQVVRLGQQQIILQSTKELEQITPAQETVIQLDDILIVQGNYADIQLAAGSRNLGIQPAHPTDGKLLITDEVGMAEILLPPRSRLAGKTIVDTSFGRVYKLTVLGIQKPNESSPFNLKNTVLEFGDSLLVLGTWRDILALKDNQRDFIVLGQPEAMLGPKNRKKAPIALLILVGMLVAMAIPNSPVSVTTASLLAALLAVLTGCLSVDEAYGAINWKSVVLIAGMIPMATALNNVGLVNIVAEGLSHSLGAFGPLALMAGLFIVTSLFTQVISNTATTVLIAPLALSAARQLGVQPYAFLMTVAIAASMAFASPVASPANTLVLGAGQYRFKDYLKIGAPMLAIMLLITMIFVPLLWHF